MSRAVVIGGGISGLASAALLAREGYEVVLLEKRAVLGGRAGSWERDGFRFDTGPSWYLMPDVFDHFYRLLGTSAAEQLELSRLDPGYRVYGEGEREPLDIAASREGNLALFERVEPGSRRRMEKYLDSARDTYEVALRRFLYTNFADYRPLVRGDVLGRMGRLGRLLLQPLDRFAARAVRHPVLRQILGYPAVFLGSAPNLTPAMYHLMSHLDLVDGVLYPQGGFTRLIESIAGLAIDEGVDLRRGVTVERIVTDSGRVVGVDYTDARHHRHRLDADLVVSAADLHHTETQLLADGERTYDEEYWQKRTAGPSALLLYLGVRGRVPELEHHTLFFSRDWGENFSAIFDEPTRVPETPSLYVCAPGKTDPNVAPEGDENLFVLVPLPADPGLGHGGIDGSGDAAIEELGDRVIDQIARWAGIPDLADRIVVRRTVAPGDFADDLNAWKGTALGPAHTLAQSAFFRTGNVSKKVAGLHYVGGSTIPGIGLPMCLISAELLIKRLRGDVTTGPLAEPLREP